MSDVRSRTTTEPTASYQAPPVSSRARDSEETRRSFTTSEFYVWAIATAAILIAGYINRSNLDEQTAWQLATAVSVAYIISRGLAKIGSQSQRHIDIR